MKRTITSEEGPFYAEQLRSGDPYELSQGHPIECLPTGARGSKANLIGGAVLETDPDVDSAGVDTGFALEAKTMRAPDIAVGNVPNTPGWAPGVPPLAVEYADTGQDEDSLQAKIVELLTAGTQLIWVVRLTSPKVVEVYQVGKKMRVVLPGQTLTAPGILRNPVQVNALFDQNAAHEAILHNLLQRAGFENGVEGIFSEGKAEGKIEGKIEGKAEGKAEGKIEATTEILIRLIQMKFGAVAQADIERIELLGNDALLACTERLLNAESVDQILTPQG